MIHCAAQFMTAPHFTPVREPDCSDVNMQQSADSSWVSRQPAFNSSDPDEVRAFVLQTMRVRAVATAPSAIVVPPLMEAEIVNAGYSKEDSVEVWGRFLGHCQENSLRFRSGIQRKAKFQLWLRSERRAGKGA